VFGGDVNKLFRHRQKTAAKFAAVFLILLSSRWRLPERRASLLLVACYFFIDH